MGPLLILKFGCASLTGYVFKTIRTKPKLAVIGGMLYAFSGFSVYNIFLTISMRQLYFSSYVGSTG
ncbi:MAG: hypothetical protein ACLSCV_07580 [Acutalibacteraceae bacterium]